MVICYAHRWITLKQLGVGRQQKKGEWREQVREEVTQLCHLQRANLSIAIKDLVRKGKIIEWEQWEDPLSGFLRGFFFENFRKNYL